ncbi:MAG: twin-arginine translocase TatA/TatE family subunit [Bacteroidia bacterium]|nr:twin-arginine translocase TatA/TatE family subunit [Bacteroidia bacterium]
MNKLLFLDNLGGGELLIVVFFVLIFFGSEKIPGLMKSMGRAMREFKTAMDDVKNDIEKSTIEPVQQLKEEINLVAKTPINSFVRNVEEVVDDAKSNLSSEIKDGTTKQSNG